MTPGTGDRGGGVPPAPAGAPWPDPDLRVGDRVELVRRIPMAEGSIIPLEPGDRGVILALGRTDCVVAVVGMRVRVPVTAVVPAGSAY